MKIDYNYLIDTKRNRLTLSRILEPDKSHQMGLFSCECGGKKITRISSFLTDRCKSCGCLKKERYDFLFGTGKTGNQSEDWVGYEEIPGRYFYSLRLGAKKRNIPFNITIEQIWDLFLKQERKCALSGMELKFNSIARSSDGSASLDRINPQKSYFIENVQWVHKHLNYIKRDLEDQEFIKLCISVANHQNSLCTS